MSVFHGGNNALFASGGEILAGLCPLEKTDIKKMKLFFEKALGSGGLKPHITDIKGEGGRASSFSSQIASIVGH
ncbi:hypothetical protein [Shewanella sp. KJ2020]|uniref:hypothetical protein n=1 Tax=Shewanella sp. KJ2020 TaxID=2919172 RepID=UPI0020A71BB7|nr:hypothetical protein [Shewanella sp. KJ2020]MCP3128414.1 hypothetical protein [Shewanella sp. KJ2020]